jgi:LytS/YehU family sensor histidine kinase
LPYAGFIQNSLWKDAQGNLWLGTDKGFCIVDTKYFKPDKKISPPHLVSFSVFDKRKTFDQPCFDLKKIKLEHNENFFSFDFSSLDFHQNSKYSYQLEGFDKDWRLASKNSATYTNVPQGTYTLHLRMQDHTGRWIESNPITVYIEPAFWETWWFLSALAVLFAFLFYAAYRFVQKRKRNKRIDSTIDYFANSLYGENSITEICWDIARNCISQLNLQDCVVYLFDEEREVLIQKAAHGQKNPKEQEIINPLEIKKGEGIAGTAASTGKPVLVKDLTKDDHHTKNGTLVKGSALAIPIIHEGKVIGVIESDHSKQNFFTSEHVKALTTIAAISANKIAEAKAEEAAKLSEIKLLEIQKLLAETQLMALRAQMNPHFVFNCLNSIQECIVTEKYGEASLYLNKFSKLFRLVLNNSSKIMISLTEEIEVLELYLTLEHMRFEKSFQYNIHVSEDLETDEILIPSMLLQPFVENALWHGLMHKPTDRILNVCFKKLSDDVFQCIIDDNGIGRRKALELKEEQSKTKRHVSKGMSICKDRIELLQKQGQHAVLQIIDKYDDAGEATGTKVIIELSSYLK